MTSCATAPIVTPPVPTPVNPPVVVPPIHVVPDPEDELFDDGEELMVGWAKGYDGYIKRVIKEELPKLLTIESARMSRWCPKWSSFDEHKKLSFYANLLWSVAGPESAWDRAMMYTESTMDTDPITGFQVRSEGLEQLSYQDLDSYGYQHSDISWQADKAAAVADYKSGRKDGTPTRTLLKARPNLHLALFIMDKHLNQFNKNQSFGDALGKYWYTIQRAHDEEALDNLKKRMPTCF